MILCSVRLVSVRRIEGDFAVPDYRDGDLVFEEKLGGRAFLLIRIRGFEE